MKSPRPSARLLALAFGAALASAAAGAAVPASAQPVAVPSAPAGTSVARYDGSTDEAANNRAFFQAVLTSVAEKRAAQPNGQAVVVTYDDSHAPSFRSQIASAASIWNSSESHVKLQEASSGADFSYYEGNDSRGSYASTDGHGSGYVFLDYTQNRQNDSVRVVTHETGHVLGLQDDYSGPCSELMSGGGPGPSCTNRYPDAAERSRVDQLWANGLAQTPGTVDQPGEHPGRSDGLAQTPGTVDQPGEHPGRANGLAQTPGTLIQPGEHPGRGHRPGRPLTSTPWG
ncbi:snapalysin [Actinacidiphila sp. bgisy167]|uniref:snapalysin n=1 Tax=Actinacidiphila sp. bgisy167 TaxID=3413797 RepID=UPI003D760720